MLQVSIFLLWFNQHLSLLKTNTRKAHNIFVNICDTCARITIFISVTNSFTINFHYHKLYKHFYLSFLLRLLQILEHTIKTLPWQTLKVLFHKLFSSSTVPKYMILHLNERCINTYASMMNYDQIQQSSPVVCCVARRI